MQPWTTQATPVGHESRHLCIDFRYCVVEALELGVIHLRHCGRVASLHQLPHNYGFNEASLTAGILEIDFKSTAKVTRPFEPGENQSHCVTLLVRRSTGISLKTLKIATLEWNKEQFPPRRHMIAIQSACCSSCPIADKSMFVPVRLFLLSHTFNAPARCWEEK